MKSAIIGLGVIGRVHAKVLKLQGRNTVAFCDVNASAAESARDEFAPKAAVYTDWKEMVERESPDVVHVCTPHYLHAEMVIYLLGKGINVLCEKPLCINRDELFAVLDAEARSGAILGVCHQNRYNAANRFAKTYLEGKAIEGAHGSVVWHRDREYYSNSDWRGIAARSGGGALINQALHTLDLCEWLCGEPQTVVARADNLAHKDISEVEDTLSAVFSGAADGKTCGNFTFFTTIAASCNLPVEISLRLASGETVTVLPHSVLESGKVIFEEEAKEFHGKPCYGNSHEALINDFYSCAKNSTPFAINGSEAAKVLRLIFAAYDSCGEVIVI